MANCGGGTVVFGVADGVMGRGNAVVGVPYHVGTHPLGRQVYNGTDPNLTPVFEEIEVPEGTGRLIAMHVHPGIPPHTDTAGRGGSQGGERLPAPHGIAATATRLRTGSQRLHGPDGR